MPDPNGSSIEIYAVKYVLLHKPVNVCKVKLSIEIESCL